MAEGARRGGGKLNRFDDMISGFSERMRMFAAFYPFFALSQKQKQPYPLAPLGLAVMLFILEDMLRADRDCTYDKIATFLQSLIERQYGEILTHEEALDLTHTLVREGLRNSGRPFAFTYPNFEKGSEETYKFDLIEFEDYEVQDKTVRLKLSSVGLELLFKTKELYNELQVSITQLYLRQQILKGVFDDALGTVEDLRLAVNSEKEKIRALEERILRDVLQVAKEQELQRRLASINERLDQEKRVFFELDGLIRDTLEEYHSGKLTEKEAQAVEKITLLQHRMHRVMGEHESLFTDKIRLQHLMNRSVESAILTTFSTRVNFENEFLYPAIHKNWGLDKLKAILDSLLSLRRRAAFHPGRIFERQPVRRLDEQGEEAVSLEIEEEQLRVEEAKERERLKEKERKLEGYWRLLLNSLKGRDEIGVNDVLKRLEQENPDKFLEVTSDLQFYHFLIQLHQMGVIHVNADREVEKMAMDVLPRMLIQVVRNDPEIQKLGAVELVAKDEIIRLPQGYVMSEFIVRRRKTNGLGAG